MRIDDMVANTSLWEDYPKFRAWADLPDRLRSEDLVRLLDQLQAVRPQSMTVTELGTSFENRAIRCVTLGNGPTRVLAWSQMHGDEPTHTAVLLDLLNFLQQSPEHPVAQSILSACTLHFIPMLNPDGVERTSRRNAQGIDVNRDALHLQSPEGRILKQAVESIEPHFAFNLHNQRPRTSVGTDPPQVAAVSLLAPPIDPHATETEGTYRAKQVAASLVDALSPYCPGMISKYRADFMPRCFGEWVQQQGVATLTIEAGGWSTAAHHDNPLVQVHFLGLASALEAIARETYLQADPAGYDGLPLSGEHDLFDVVIRGVSMVSGYGQQPFAADLGINFTDVQGHGSPPGGGVIEDLGDLCVTTGKSSVEKTGLICLPGRVAYVPEIAPNRLPDSDRVRDLLRLGVTTAIGKVDLTDSAECDALEDLSRQLEIPIHLGFVAELAAISAPLSEEIHTRLMFAASCGVLGLLSADVPEAIAQFLEWFDIPLLHEEELPSVSEEMLSLVEICSKTCRTAQRLGLHDRGRIDLGAAADLVILRTDDEATASSGNPWSGLHQVMVAGTVAFDGGEVVGGIRGTLLTSRLARPAT